MRFNAEKAVTTGGKKRLTLLLPQRAVERLSWLQRVTEAPNVTEVIRMALYTYAVLVEARANGSEIRQVLPDGSTSPLPLMIDVGNRPASFSGEERQRKKSISPEPTMA